MKTRHFTREEVKKWAGEGVDEIEGKDRRWSRTNTTIVQIEDKFYSVYWECGLTECQENEYEAQDAPEVKMVEEEKVIKIKKWVNAE